MVIIHTIVVGGLWISNNKNEGIVGGLMYIFLFFYRVLIEGVS